MAAKSKSKKQRENLEINSKSGWEQITGQDKRQINGYCRDYLRFMSRVKTEREFFGEARDILKQNGYKELAQAKNLKPGDKVFRPWRGKVMMAFHVGRKPITEGVHILGGHIDAPRLDTKPSPLYEDGEMAWLDTHYYGGIKKYQWVTMPLAVHGVVALQNGESVTINIGEDRRDPAFVVTDLLPHLGKEQEKKSLAEGIPGENLNVLVGSMPVADTDNDGEKNKIKKQILQLLHEKYGIKEEDLTSADMEIVPAGPARELGFDRSMLLAYAHDDRVCSYASLQALVNLTETPEYTSVLLLSDKEEVGSVGATGMESTVFENTVADVISRREQGYNDLKLRQALENSRMISADVNPVHDPNYPDVSSPNNMAKMNGGLIITKYTGSRGKAHASEADGSYMAVLRRIFNKGKVVWQTGEIGKVDAGGGGTIAMFLARYGMDVVDCGVGILNMHSPWEVVGKLDTYMAYKGYRLFLEDDREQD